MLNIQASYPIVIYFIHVISQEKSTFESCLSRIFAFFGALSPIDLLFSILTQITIGFGYQSHYREMYPMIKTFYGDEFKTYGVDKIKEYVGKINNSMITWKLCIFQAKMVKKNCPELLSEIEKITADIDVSTLQSAAKKKEGSEAGYNKKSKGKPCFQLSATFIGRIFVDLKLFPGSNNPKDFFKKAVNRVISLNFGTKIIRADGAYGTLDNLLHLNKLCLGYAIVVSKSFTVVKEGIVAFKKLAKKKSPQIIKICKGVSIFDFGWVTLENGVKTRLIIVRRISRRRKKGKIKVKAYYYGICSDLELTPVKLYKFYHKRQCIEAGFRELKNHYHLEKLPFKNLKANEFWIACKIFAMTLFKMFQVNTLSKSLHTLLRKTFFRKILQKGLFFDSTGKVHVAPKFRYKWHLRRMLKFLDRIRAPIET